MNEPERLRELIKTEFHRLTQYLDTLPAEAWSKPSACDAWTVGDVVGHLVFVAEFYSDVISRGVQGDISVSPFFKTIDLEDRSALAKILEVTAIERREALGEQLLPSLVSQWDQFERLLDNLKVEDWEKPCWRWSQPTPVRQHLVLAVQELAIHGWDIRFNLEDSPSLSEDLLPMLVDRAIRRFRVVTELSDSLRVSESAGPVRYQFDITGTVPGKHDMVIEGDLAQMQPIGTENPDVIFRCDTVTFVLMMYQRLTAASATAAGNMTAEGDENLITDFNNRRFQRG